VSCSTAIFGELGGLFGEDPCDGDDGLWVIAALAQGRHRLRRQAEQEKIIHAHRLADLDVGPVQGTNGQGAVQGELLST